MNERRTDITHNLVFLRRDEEILLAMKKRGAGEGKWNGAGGKPEQGESIIEAAVRETKEEIGVKLNEAALKHVAVIYFYGGSMEYVGADVYTAEQWEGEPEESEEMRPQWFSVFDIPYEQMWDDDKFWLPEVLKGRKIKAEFYFTDDNEVAAHTLKDLNV